MAFDHEVIAREVEERFGPFIREAINSTAVHRDQTYTTFDVSMLREMGRLGLIGFTGAKSIGGQERTWQEWGHALEEIGYLADDSGLPMLLSYRETANGLVHRSGLDGRPHLIERYAKPAVRGEAYIGWLYTEEKDVLNLETQVVEQGGRYVLNGVKTASTGGQSCTSWIVYAAMAGRDDTMALMVEREDPGVTVTPLRTQGLRSIGMATVSFEDVELGEDRVVAARDGLSHGQIFVNERRVTGASWLLGRMRSLIEKVIDDTEPKIRLGRRLVEYDTFKSNIGRMSMALERARSSTYRMLERIESLRDSRAYVHEPLVPVAKYLSTEAALEVADLAQRLSGGHGYFEPYGIERYLRDFYGLVPIIGGQIAIETQVGDHVIWRHGRRRVSRNKTQAGA